MIEFFKLLFEELLREPLTVIIGLLDLVVLFYIVKEIDTLTKVGKTNEGLLVTVKNAVNTIDDAQRAVLGGVQILERDQLYHYLTDSASGARRSLHHLSYAFSNADDTDPAERERAVRFLDAVKAAKERTPGLDVKFIGPELEAKIGGMLDREETGGEVRLHPSVISYDYRFQIVDGESVVFGIGRPGLPTNLGFLIKSTDLAAVLEKTFANLWGSGSKLQDLLTSVLERILTNNFIHTDQLEFMRQQLGIRSSTPIRNCVEDCKKRNVVIEFGRRVGPRNQVVQALTHLLGTEPKTLERLDDDLQEILGLPSDREAVGRLLDELIKEGAAEKTSEELYRRT
ncbi:MAG TPA: hypothetical protein VE974_29065 [Thermoanaerobaculia bacterium]|nr:hypothetical protein [Thermoanaerobaculia bacterium]